MKKHSRLAIAWTDSGVGKTTTIATVQMASAASERNYRSSKRAMQDGAAGFVTLTRAQRT